MSFYAVDHFLDQIKIKSVQERDFSGMDAYLYFETERAANEFIVSRAEHKMNQAERGLFNARKRYQKCLKKFGKPLAKKNET